MQTDYCVLTENCVKRPLSNRPEIGFQDQLSLNAGQKYCSILQYFRPSLSYHLSLRYFLLSIFEWPFYTGFTVYEDFAINLICPNFLCSIWTGKIQRGTIERANLKTTFTGHDILLLKT